MQGLQLLSRYTQDLIKANNKLVPGWGPQSSISISISMLLLLGCSVSWVGCLAAVSVISGCVLWAHFGWLITHVNQDSKQRRHAVNPCVMAAEVVAIGVGQQVRLIVRPRRQRAPKGARRDAAKRIKMKWKKNLLPQRCTLPRLWQYLLLLLLLLWLDWCALYVNWAVVFAFDALSRDNQQQQHQQ